MLCQGIGGVAIRAHDYDVVHARQTCDNHQIIKITADQEENCKEEN